MSDSITCDQCGGPAALPIDVRLLEPWSGEYRTKRVCSKMCVKTLRGAVDELAPIRDAPRVEIEVEWEG